MAAAGVGRVVLDTRPLYATDAVSAAALDERRSKPRPPIVTDVMGEEPVVRVIAGDDVGTAFAGLSVWTEQVVEWLGRRPSPVRVRPSTREP